MGYVRNNSRQGSRDCGLIRDAVALRYTLSSCMFGIPEERVSISSPCQVTCTPLNVSIGYQLSNDTSGINPNLGFCTAAQFDDSTINNCAFCYSFIPQQLFLANCKHSERISLRELTKSSPTSIAHYLPRPTNKWTTILPQCPYHIQ